MEARVLNIKSQIIKLNLDKFGIRNYEITSEGIVNVFGDVDISGLQLTEIPFIFGKVEGSFDCSCNNLNSLIGCPKDVYGNFYCYNNNLFSLEGSPNEVSKDFICSFNKLVNLNGCSSEIGGDLLCNDNFLKDLDISSIIKGNIFCHNNKIKKNYNFYGEANDVVLETIEDLVATLPTPFTLSINDLRDIESL